MKKTLALAALGLAAAAVVPLTSSSSHAIPLCVQYNDPIHHGSYPYCPLDHKGTVVAQELPLPVGVSTGKDGICVTVSYQVPQCVPVSTT